MLNMFNTFPTNSGMLWDTRKGIIPCAPLGHEFVRKVLPRMSGELPAPRPLPGKFEGYSMKSSIASSIRTTANRPRSPGVNTRRTGSRHPNAAPPAGNIRGAGTRSPNTALLGDNIRRIDSRSPNGAPPGGPGPSNCLGAADGASRTSGAGNSYLGFDNPESRNHHSPRNEFSRHDVDIGFNLITPSFNGNLVGGFSSLSRFNSLPANLNAAYAREFSPQLHNEASGHGRNQGPEQNTGVRQQDRLFSFRFPVPARQ
ncbi:hypothetical protein BDD12DRAFT_391521 [Trichophaea hybrida]|nr:hypothetical protein BDD12DRAFT_391521 [Trichophaea hybrida]